LWIKELSGRYKALALTALEEAYCWIGKAIRDDQIACAHPDGCDEEVHRGEAEPVIGHDAPEFPKPKR